MKNLLLLVLLLCKMVIFGYAQESKVSPSKATPNYSSFHVESKLQTWTLVNVELHHDYTLIQIQIIINNNSAGYFSFPSNISISGDFETLYPYQMFIGDESWDVGKPYSYPKNNKGNGVRCTLVFSRIPAGVSTFVYCEPGFIQWDKISLPHNPPTKHTAWTESALKNQWTQYGSNPIEGIYHFMGTNNKEWWGTFKHTLGVLKTDDGYEIIYLKGSHSGVWKEGDLKAQFVPTAVKGLYKVSSWLMESKMENPDFYLKFDKETLYIYENDNSVNAEFLKLYPAEDHPIVEDQERPVTTGPNMNQSQNRKKSGSGIVVSQKGVIATNLHTIANANAIEIVVKNASSIVSYKAKPLCVDKANDLALLIIDDEKFKEFRELPYAISKQICDVGTSVFAMGYPLASLMGDEVKITDGIINSKTGYEGDIVTYQISAPIQPGNSGGPLFDKKGDLVGITNAGILAANNVGYAIKSIYLCNLIESAPISIEMPINNKLQTLELTNQIKSISPFVVYIIAK